jgi:hypothetical protein
MRAAAKTAFWRWAGRDIRAEYTDKVNGVAWKNGVRAPENGSGRGAPLAGARLRGGTQWGVGLRGLSTINKVFLAGSAKLVWMSSLMDAGIAWTSSHNWAIDCFSTNRLNHLKNVGHWRLSRSIPCWIGNHKASQSDPSTPQITKADQGYHRNRVRLSCDTRRFQGAISL